MAIKKGKIVASISLTQATCYQMQNGICSLELIDSLYISPTVRLAPNELLYCPRLYTQMKARDDMKPLPISLHDCGHADVDCAYQRTCIASKKRIEQEIIPDDEVAPTLCRMCAGQITFDPQTAGKQNVTLRVRYRDNNSSKNQP